MNSPNLKNVYKEEKVYLVVLINEDDKYNLNKDLIDITHNPDEWLKERTMFRWVRKFHQGRLNVDFIDYKLNKNQCIGGYY